ncbi:hypothetical protein DIPPA_03754 [Diplonema papillatum]|nr:hypothetical protein DIPPA_03754 [Diplonema papillatum]
MSRSARRLAVVAVWAGLARGIDYGCIISTSNASPLGAPCQDVWEKLGGFVGPDYKGPKCLNPNKDPAGPWCYWGTTSDTEWGFCGPCSSPAPDTQAPRTAAPATMAPTSAPLTEAPATFAPTGSPPTIPPTMAPTTPPATTVPDTVVPSTAPPATASPPTGTPLTDVPAPTQSPPPATVPPTGAPLTQAPSEAPRTQAPPTGAAPTEAPTQAPPVNPPDTTAAPPPVVPATRPPRLTLAPGVGSTWPPETRTPPAGKDTLSPGATWPPDTAVPGGGSHGSTLAPGVDADQQIVLFWSGSDHVSAEQFRDGGVVVTLSMRAPAETVAFYDWGDDEAPFTIAVDKYQKDGLRELVDAGARIVRYVDHSATNLVIRIGGGLADYRTGIAESFVLTAQHYVVKQRIGLPQKGYQLRGDLHREVVIQPEEDTYKEKVSEVGSTMATVLAGGGGAVPAQTIAFIAGLKCGEKSDPELHWIFHPTAASIDGRQCFGAVIFNPLLVLLCLLSQYAATYVLLHVRKLREFFMEMPYTFKAAEAVVFSPSGTLLAAVVLFQGTSVCSIAMLFYPDGFLHAVVGLLTVLLQVAFVVWLTRRLRRAVPTEARYRREMESTTMKNVRPPGGWRVFLFGPGEWVSLHRATRFAKRYSVVLRHWRQQCVGWICVDFAVSLLSAILAAFRPKTFPGCGNLRILLGTATLAVCAAYVAFFPFVRQRDNYISIFRAATSGVGYIFIGIAYHLRDIRHTVHDIGGVLITLAVIAILVKVLLDFMTFLNLMITHRRAKLQLAEWADLEDRRALEEAKMLEAGADPGSEMRLVSPESSDSVDHTGPDPTWEALVADAKGDRLSWKGLLGDVEKKESAEGGGKPQPPRAPIPPASPRGSLRRYASPAKSYSSRRQSLPEALIEPLMLPEADVLSMPPAASRRNSAAPSNDSEHSISLVNDSLGSDDDVGSFNGLGSKGLRTKLDSPVIAPYSARRRSSAAPPAPPGSGSPRLTATPVIGSRSPPRARNSRSSLPLVSLEQ